MWGKIALLCIASIFIGGVLGANSPFTEDGVEIAPSNLVTVVLVFRHGDRTPIKPYPTDPYKNVSLWPVGFGQLTNRGKQQHFELGQWFRKRYTNFLPEKYSEKDVYVRSTDVDRTLMSAESNLAGLYPPEDNQIWNSNLLWQPIPIHTKPETDDVILAMKKPCPKYDILYKQLRNSDEIRAINKRNKELYEYLSKYSGNKVKTIQDLEYLYSNLYIESIYNFTLPKWTEAVFPDKMKPTASLSFALSCYNKELARLKAGPFFAEMLDNLYNTTTGIKHKHNRKLWMYSGHDTTIANLLMTMGVFEFHTPPYTAAIMIELYSGENEGDFYVNVIYKNSSIPQKMIIPGCDFDCPLTEFTRLLTPILLPKESYDTECRLPLLSLASFENMDSEFTMIFLGIIGGVLLILIFLILCSNLRNKKTQQQNYVRIPDRDEHV